MSGPAQDQTAAVLCNPIMFPSQQAAVQITIIEVTIPTIPEYPTIAFTLLTITAASIALIYVKKTSYQLNKPRTQT